jgi:hypothetical protein
MDPLLVALLRIRRSDAASVHLPLRIAATRGGRHFETIDVALDRAVAPRLAHGTLDRIEIAPVPARQRSEG